jgi:hypothetical protein
MCALLDELVCLPFIGDRNNLECILSAPWQIYETLYLLFSVQECRFITPLRVQGSWCSPWGWELMHLSFSSLTQHFIPLCSPFIVCKVSFFSFSFMVLPENDPEKYLGSNLQQEKHSSKTQRFSKSNSKVYLEKDNGEKRERETFPVPHSGNGSKHSK